MIKQFIATTADQLKKGDIFSFGTNAWDEEMRFHSYRFYVDKKQEWVDEYKPGSRICFNYTSFNYAGPIEEMGCNSFQWQHVQNPTEIKVYLQANHKISEHGKHKGKIYFKHNGQRVYVPYKVNPVNMMEDIPV